MHYKDRFGLVSLFDLSVFTSFILMIFRSIPFRGKSRIFFYVSHCYLIEAPFNLNRRSKHLGNDIGSTIFGVFVHYDFRGTTFLYSFLSFVLYRLTKPRCHVKSWQLW